MNAGAVLPQGVWHALKIEMCPMWRTLFFEFYYGGPGIGGRYHQKDAHAIL